jgi:predicted transcriptional regulator
MMTERKTSIHRLGDLQLKIMKVLWEQREVTVAVHQALEPATSLAYTTIATMLRKMEARGLVSHRLEGRNFVYRAAVAEKAVTGHMASDLLERVFAGSLADMVSHLLTTREISRAELVKLQRIIAQRRKKL